MPACVALQLRILTFTGSARGSPDFPESWINGMRARESLPSDARMRLWGATGERQAGREPRGIYMATGRRNGASGDAWFLKKYELELARGASHIASMLCEESMQTAVRETVLQFEATHGRDELKIFTHALARKLEERGRPKAVEALQRFVKRGQSSGGTPGATLGTTAPHPVARKRPRTRAPKAS
jgi:hypothetical protein